MGIKQVLMVVMLLVVGLAQAEAPRRILLVHPDEFTEKWVNRAASIGIDAIEIHPTGGGTAADSLAGLLKLLEQPEFRARIDRARQMGLEVGYEFHAASWLLPRDLFVLHPEYFRMNEKGERCRETNFCFSNETAMKIAASRAVELANRLYGSLHRYFFWADDVQAGACKCEKCRELSESDQQLRFVNCIVTELRKTIPDAQLCYLAYLGSINPPQKTVPAPGVFLEYAPISRDMKRALAAQDNSQVRPLRGLLELFGKKDARVLEYWFDNSLFSNWKKPPKKFEAQAAVVQNDLAYYRNLGFSEIASFACFLGDDYEKLWGEPNVTSFTKGFFAACKGLDKTDFTWSIKAGRFYFQFEVVDETVHAVKEVKAKRDLEHGDRVEVFWSPREDMSVNYYCAEIDPQGRVLDYACKFPRVFDYNWQFKTLEKESKRTEHGYRVEGSVSVDELKQLGINLSCFWMGAFRADFDEAGQLVEWYSLMPPGPGEADFHRPCMLFKVENSNPR